MVLVVVRWYIKKDKKDEFKNLWINDMDPKEKGGLFREFFSTPVRDKNEKYHTLDFESSYYTTYINVGLWKDLKSFDSAIGSFIPDRKKSATQIGKEIIEVFDFEFKLRERIVMKVEEDRNGRWILPNPSVS